MDIQGITLDVDVANTCGLIVTELVSNSLKHAFPEGREGQIRISFRKSKSQRFMLMVADDGVGLPTDLDFKSSTSLGLRLVRSLARQLKATVEIQSDNGTETRLTFRVNLDRGDA